MREHSLAKVPLLLVVGKREAEEGTVAVRRLGSDEHQKIMGLDEARRRHGQASDAELAKGASGSAGRTRLRSAP